MPIYSYECPDCKTKFEIAKSIRYIEDSEYCPHCKKIANRLLSLVNFQGADDWNTAHYSPALGKWVKSNKELKDEAKKKGLIEVGNEKPEVLEKYAERKRKEAEQATMKFSEKELRGIQRILSKED